MKKLVLLAGLLMCGLLVAGPAMAQVTTTPTTLQDLLNDSAQGGFLIQDKLFTNFSYSGTGHDAASNVLVSVDFSAGTTTDRHGFTFTKSNGDWNSDFTLSYKISVAPGNPDVFMTQSFDQLADSQLDGTNGLPKIADTQTGVTPSPIMVANFTTGTLSAFSNTYNLTSITTTSVATVVGSQGLQSYEQDWFEAHSPRVPEPSMLLLLGAGLVGVVGFGRKFKK